MSLMENAEKRCRQESKKLEHYLKSVERERRLRSGLYRREASHLSQVSTSSIDNKLWVLGIDGLDIFRYNMSKSVTLSQRNAQFLNKNLKMSFCRMKLPIGLNERKKIDTFWKNQVFFVKER